MKKLLIAAAAVVVLPVIANAAAMDPLCKNPYQGSNQSWAEHYGCWGHPGRTMTAAPAPMMHHHHHHHHHKV